jgi:hypothetical protein
MGSVSRRGFLLSIGSGVAVSAVGASASATVVRSLSLPALVQGSRRIVVVTALGSTSHYEELGRRRRIVTDTRVRVDEGIAKTDDLDSELMVRTLGGSVAGVGELVHGQAQLVLGEPCVMFLLQGPDGLHYVNGMAALGAAEQQAFLDAHPDVYERSHGAVRLKISRGRIALASLDCTGYASAAMPDFGAMQEIAG